MVEKNIEAYEPNDLTHLFADKPWFDAAIKAEKFHRDYYEKAVAQLKK